ncbi:MAG: glycerol-3-phosphate dehydrogenase/oxidase [Gammaproteobacteria bacterium]|nr:glycerol-3-phosphate dehydrogenase/oxidase [Gammaproteobacteria bacterium]
MNGRPAALADKAFDVAIIGGGIFGACAAWDAALRGFSVALVERGDFCSGTSANSFKIVHGGIRYLQHGDLVRLRTSCYERTALLRIAPHLVQPLPIVIPTYGRGRQGKALLGAGMVLYDLLTLDRTRGIKDAQRKIPWARFLSRQELLDLFPGIQTQTLTGGVVFCDGQFYNPARLVLAFLQSAVNAGAVVANYVEATAFLCHNGIVEGIVGRDALTGESYPIQAKVVLNAAGPWAERILNKAIGLSLRPQGSYSRDACFLIPRPFTSSHALAVQARTRDPDAVLSRAARHLFIVPWRDYTLIGVWHVVYKGEPDAVTVSERDLGSFIDEVNWAYPALDLSLADVSMWNAGLVPFGENLPGVIDLSYGKRSRLIDHEQEHGLKGLVTLIGIRYTMARSDAAHAMDLIAKKLGKGGSRPATDRTTIHGGQIESFDSFVKQAVMQSNQPVDSAVMRALIHNHGSEYKQVLKLAEEDPAAAETLENSNVLKAEVVNAVRNEMVFKLSDVVFRRTDLGAGGNPGDQALRTCADIVAKELGWTADQAKQELLEVTAQFPKFQDTRHRSEGEMELARTMPDSPLT